ncbi:MAG: dual specificity protein phosphatase family protein [Mesorhizobium sp.]|nr:dual specificity protein phosphatase family protein [Mesorhizobium sp.]
MRAVATLALGLLLFGCFLGYRQISGNFHVVAPGELYRSAQPTPDRLAGYVAAHGIRTVVNLRGANDGAGWYDAEKRASAALGLNHIDFAMSARARLGDERMSQLIAILLTAEKPILVHCMGGADRSGLASALYLTFVKGVAPEIAERQLSIFYGHFAVSISKTMAMDETFDAIEATLGGNDV